MSVDEAAAVLGQTSDVVWRYVRSGDLAHIRVQGAEAIEYRILSRDVHDMQAKMRAAADQPSTAPAIDHPPATPPTARQPIGERLAAAVEDAARRPSMTMMRPPTGLLKADAATITHAGAFGIAGGSSKTVDTPARPESPAAGPSSATAPSASPAAREAAPPELGVRSFMAGASLAPSLGAPRVESTAETTAAQAPPPAASGDQAPTAEPVATPPRRPALPPINSVVTVSGSAVQRIGQPGLTENDALRMFQTLVESLVAPITAANDRLADENTRLLELARMQSQALEKVNAERDVLMERLIGLPAEMGTLYERLGALQAEVHRLEQAGVSRAGGTPQAAIKTAHISWWRRLFGFD
jgi:hypothetical protein